MSRAQAAADSTMHTIDTHHDYTVSPERLWALIADFGNIEAWWPRGGEIEIERVDLEGEGVGMVRHIYNRGMPAAVSERLEGLEPAELTWHLSIVGDRPAGLLRYRATGRIEPFEQGGCRIRYHGEFEAEPGREDEARAFLQGAYGLMLRGLEQAARQA